MARTTKRWNAVAIIVLVGLVMTIPAARTAEASETASGISLATGAISLWHAGITAVAPNPVTGTTSIIYACISLGAGIYDAVTDPLPESAPVITQIVAGPATDRDTESGELIAGGIPITEAPAGRMISILGSDFSFVQEENVVTFDGLQAATSPLSTGGLISTVVPFVDAPFPRVVSVQVAVKGIVSNTFSFTVLASESLGENTGRVLGKMRTLSLRIEDFDWEAFLDVENPNLTPAERAEALAGADDMVQCAADARPFLVQYSDLLDTDPQFLMSNEEFLLQSPEIEVLLDQALALLPPTCIPTVSEWSLIVMTVLILTAGTIVVGWRRRSPAA